MAAINRSATATIALNASLSGPVSLGAGTLCGIIIPTGWTAAIVSFQASPDNGVTWYDVYTKAGVELTIAPVTNAYTILDADTFQGLSHIKVRSGATGAAQNQGAARTITLFNRILGFPG